MPRGKTHGSRIRVIFLMKQIYEDTIIPVNTMPLQRSIFYIIKGARIYLENIE